MTSTAEDLFNLPLPDRFNLCEYYLDRNLVEGRADKVAIRCGDEEWTYGEIARRVRAATVSLRKAGLRPEERVLLALPDGIDFVVAWFAVLRAGGVFAMVNPLLKGEEFQAYLEYSKARVLVTHASVLAAIEEPAREARWCETVWVSGADSDCPKDFTPFDDVIANGASEADGSLGLVEPTGPDDLAGWLFTSGSTGRPKACVHMHRDFAYSTETYALQVVRYREDDVCLSVPKLFFGYATGTNLMFPFRVGATVVLFPERSTADTLFDLIERHKPTFLTSVPTLINNMLRSERVDTVDLSCLRVCLSAGEALPPALYAEWHARTDVEILDGIGSAEMFHIYISNYPGDVRPGSLGRLVPGYTAEIVDDDGQPVADDSPGRLRVRGGSTALGYWANKESSEETFQGAWCTTADMFQRDSEGYFSYLGRGDDLLKVSGIWVAPLEIENVLLQHPAVKDVCVVGRQDDQGLVKPLAYLVPCEGEDGCDELAATLKAHVKERLAPYKYPRWFEWRDELPRNDRGKVARKVLVAEAQESRG